MKVHTHDWKLSGSKWKCLAPDHVHDEPDILDAASIWHALGVIKTHLGDKFPALIECDCGWTGYTNEYGEHLDDAIFYWLRDIEPTI